jgi:hypothetical protein
MIWLKKMAHNVFQVALPNRIWQVQNLCKILFIPSFFNSKIEEK